MRMTARRSPLLWSLTVSAGLVAVLSPVACAQTVAVVGVSTGVNTSTGERPSRRDLNDVYNEKGPHWDLLVQAMDLFQKEDLNDPASFYQISGIHGLPFEAWDGVGQVEGGRDGGYCPHGQTTFVTWHRPHMALFEQALASHAQKVASQYPTESIDTYKAAADTFRLPYWDWANDARLPEAVTQQTVGINAPSGASTVVNPLYSYSFPNFPFTDGGFGGALASYNETKRCMDTSDASVYVSDPDVASSKLSDDGDRLKDKVVSSRARREKQTNKGASFEDPHNTVHNDISCGSGRIGHMGDLSYAAFDPLFFFHHVNVDRLFAIWQAIYYDDTIFTTSQNGNSLYGTPAGEQTADSPLRPFWAVSNGNADDDSAFHTSRSVESTRTFGYTYPEIVDWNATPDEVAASARAAVNRLYGNSDDASSSRRRWTPRQGKRILPSVLSSTDYSVELSVERSELPLPCYIDLWLDSDSYGAASTKVGETVLLTMPMEGTAYTVAPLRRPLRALEGLLSLVDADAVVNMLQQRLQVTITTANGTSIPVDSVSSLTVEIHQRAYEAAASIDVFPQFGPIVRLPVALSL